MGLMDKFKNLFTEEVEEEVKPIKKEVRHVEIPSPKRETKMVEDIETPASPKEDKFVFPVYFDDKDFADLEKPKQKKETLQPKKEPKIEGYQGTKVQTKVEKKFQASPIISPVYGILDKNYKKEDIATKIESQTDYYRSSKPVTVDDIRNKAFGTLEDDLENTLFGNNSILLKEEMEEKVEPIDIFAELDLEENHEESVTLDEDELSREINEESEVEEDDTVILAKQLEEQKRKLEEINEYINENAIDEIDVDLKTNEEIEKPVKEDDKKTDEDEEDLTDSELLGLVDTMYEKREEEE